jgi:hypothetical protein
MQRVHSVISAGKRFPKIVISMVYGCGPGSLYRLLGHRHMRLLTLSGHLRTLAALPKRAPKSAL